MKYVVIELQDNGSSVANLVTAFDDVYQAEQKYHQVLAAAAVSSLPCHSAVMVNSEGMYIKSESYKHGENQEA